MKFSGYLPRQKFIYKVGEHVPAIVVPFSHQSVLGEVKENRAYLFRDSKYYHILAVERQFDNSGDLECQIFICVEATVEDWLAIKHYLFPGDVAQ